jgi:hypothetical protein
MDPDVLTETEWFKQNIEHQEGNQRACKSLPEKLHGKHEGRARRRAEQAEPRTDAWEVGGHYDTQPKSLWCVC